MAGGVEEDNGEGEVLRRVDLCRMGDSRCGVGFVDGLDG